MTNTFAALQNSNYRWLLSGNIAQFFAIAARMMLCNLLAWEITQQEISLALINLALAIPMFIGALVAGALVDRFERRRLIILGLLVIVISELSIVIALFSSSLSFYHLLVVTFMGGCAHPFIHPASTAMMYSLLGPKVMANGVALLSSGMNLSRILGPAITGGVLAAFNASYAYSLVAALFFLALVCQWRLPDDKPESKDAQPLWRDIKNGFLYLLHDRSIGICLLFSLPPLMLLMTTQYVLVLFANTVWQTGDWGLGMLLTAMGLGAFLGALAVARFGSHFGRMPLMVGAAVVSTLFFIAFSQTGSFYWALGFLLSANFCAAMTLVTNQIIVQLLADDGARGRVSGYILMSYSLAPLAMFPISLMADRVGVDNAVTIAAVVVLCLIVVFFLSSKVLKGIDEQLRQKSAE